MSSTDTCDLLNISRARLTELIGIYDIPHVKLSCGIVFLKSDIEAFQESRKDKMKYARKEKRIKNH